MKPILEKIDLDYNCSFSVKKDILPYIAVPWHYHPEFELVHIKKGYGKRFVGDSIDNFKEGDLALLGPNLPHVWKNDDVFYKNIPGLNVEVDVICFKENVFGSDFFDLPEMAAIQKLLQNAARGILINTPEAKGVIAKMGEVLKEKPVKRVSLLIDILDDITRLDGLEFLASQGFVESYSNNGADKLDKVYEYISNHFKDDIDIENLADISNLSKTSFCRFFKSKTTKTFTQYLNEIRIGYAKKLLVEGKLNVSQIGYECGYNNPSYFNRQFKNIVQLSPLEFQAKHAEK